MRAIVASVFIVGLFAACGGDDAPPSPDGGVDAGARDAGSTVDGSASSIAETRLPILTPCAAGWREVAPASEGDVPTCSPWPTSGPADCPVGEAHFPGTAGCELVSVACPADGFPADLPSAGAVLFVRAGADVGVADGSRGTPFATIGAAVAVAPSGATIAIAVGTYDEKVTIVSPITLQGACSDVVIGGVTSGPAIAIFDTPGVAVRDVRLSGRSDGVWATNSEVIVERVIVEGDPFLCIRSAGGSTMTGERLSLIGCSSAIVNTNSTTTLRHVDVRAARMEGIKTTGGVLQIEDIALRQADGDLSAIIGEGGTLTITRGAFAAETGAVWLESYLFADTYLALTDTVFEGPALDVDARPVAILALDPRVVLELTRVSLSRMRGLALALTEVGSTLTLRDVVLSDVLPSSGMGAGHAIEIGAGAALDAERVLVARASGYGILIDGVGTTATMGDISVSATRAESTGFAGRALQVQRGALVTVERAHVYDNREVAVVAAGTGTSLVLNDVWVERTLPRACAPAACPEAGIGVGSYLAASVRAERFLVDSNHLIGFQLAADGEIDLWRGIVSGHVIGVNVQADGYDPSRLSREVTYRDNDVNLDARSLPVPDPTAPVTM